MRKDTVKPRTRLLLFFSVLLAMLALTAAWQGTSLGDWLRIENIRTAAEYLRESALSPVIVLGAYVIGSLVMIPVTLLIAGTALTFSPAGAFVYSMIGSLLSAAAAYGIGRFLGRDVFRRFPGSRVNRLSRKLATHGIITITGLRLLPVAPFTVVNMAAGASHIRLPDFLIGTLLGMAPGVLAITLLARQIEAALREPDIKSFIALGALIVLTAAGFLIIHRRLKGRDLDGRT